MDDLTNAKITVDGCDDSTSIVVALSPTELAFIQDIAARITKESRYGCMPTMFVEVMENTHD